MHAQLGSTAGSHDGESGGAPSLSLQMVAASSTTVVEDWAAGLLRGAADGDLDHAGGLRWRIGDDGAAWESGNNGCR